MKIDYIKLNLSSAIIYSLFFIIEQKTGFAFPIQIMGTAYLLLIMPFTIIQLFPAKNLSPIEKYFSFLTIYFCFFVPTYYLLNQVFNFKISASHTFILNIIIFLATLFIKKPRETESISFPKNVVIKINKEIIFITTLVIFFIIHALNFHFYGFIPEWDGYSDLIKINTGLSTGTIAQTYRGFFYTSMQALAGFSKINPYYIFSIILISLQTTLILTVKRLLYIYKIEKTFLQIVAYSMALSIPVINMETDMSRPQNIVILFLPIIIYFIHQFFYEKKYLYAVLTGIIAIAGINYHEFFIFPLLICAGWIVFHFIKKMIQPKRKDDLIISSLTILSIILIGIILTQKSTFLIYTINTLKKISVQITDISSWKIWFIGSYSSDGASIQMGWPGIGGAFKYYAYYMSPQIAIIFIILLFLLIKNYSFLKNNLILKVSAPFLAILILFAEILPRFNYAYLPERFWLLIDIILVLAIIPLLQYFSENKYKKQLYTFFLISCLIGLSGSIYIATQKKSLTSKNEFKAAQWIENNTPENSYFISQSANGPMIGYFGKRSMITPKPEYFLSDKILEKNIEENINMLEISINDRLENAKALSNDFITDNITFLSFSDLIQKEKNAIETTKAKIKNEKETYDKPGYILYSHDKFNNIYANRDWWKNQNFDNANLKKFNKAYPLVYNKDGIFIWKITKK